MDEPSRNRIEVWQRGRKGTQTEADANPKASAQQWTCTMEPFDWWFKRQMFTATLRSYRVNATPYIITCSLFYGSVCRTDRHQVDKHLTYENQGQRVWRGRGYMMNSHWLIQLNSFYFVFRKHVSDPLGKQLLAACWARISSGHVRTEISLAVSPLVMGFELLFSLSDSYQTITKHFFLFQSVFSANF